MRPSRCLNNAGKADIYQLSRNVNAIALTNNSHLKGSP